MIHQKIILLRDPEAEKMSFKVRFEDLCSEFCQPFSINKQKCKIY